MHRYLISFNYKGTRFCGSQKNTSRKKTCTLAEKLRDQRTHLIQLEASDLQLLADEEKSIQGAIETGLEYRLKPAQPAILNLSSRTDTGVHAYKNTCTVELQHPESDKYYDPLTITERLNYHFVKRNLDIRINETLAVHPNFRVRQDAYERSYIYQIVTTSQEPRKKSSLPLPKSTKITRSLKANNRSMGAYNSLLPVQFSDLYLQVRESEFNYDQMCEAMSIMEGTHNFKSFCTARGHFHYGKEEGTDKYISVRRREEEFIKTMFQIKVEPVGSPLPKLPQFQHFKFYNIHINGNAFLHNQIRRMVGAGLCVCEGRLKLDSISRMLAYPDDGYHNKARPAEPHGLFLADVKYTEQSMQGATHEYNHMPVQPLEEDVNMYVVGQHLQGATDGLSQPIDNFVDDA